MAGIDYTIPGQIKGLQLESPINAMMEFAQLQGLQQQQQMNALKTQEAKETSRQRNALAAYLANPKRPTDALELEAGVRQVAPLLADQFIDTQLKRADLTEKTNKRKLDESALKSKITQEDLERSIAHITSFRDLPSIYADLDKRVASGELDPAKADQLRNTLPPDESGLLDWKRNLHLKLLNAKDRLDEERKFADRTQPKPEKIEQNGQISFIDMNPNSPTYGRPTGPAEAITDKTPKYVAKDLNGKIVYVDENQFSPTFGQQKQGVELTKTAGLSTESDLARLQRERADIFKANEDDPRLKQYDAAIAKATATNQPLSDLARKQNELADLEEQLKADPTNKLLQQRIKEYRDDIRKDTQFKPVTNVSVAAPVTPVTIQDPNDPSKAIVVDGRTGKVIGASIKEGPGTDLTAKERQTREAKYPQATAAVKTFESKSEQLAKDLEKLANHPGLDGISGAVYGRLPSGTKNSMAAQELYNSIVARGGFKELADMRAASPTGGALGNVSNQEGQYLRDAFASIGRIQSKDDLAAALIDAAKRTRESKGRIREAYDMTYEYRSGGSSNAAPAAPKSDIQNKADAVLRGAK